MHDIQYKLGVKNMSDLVRKKKSWVFLILKLIKKNKKENAKDFEINLSLVKNACTFRMMLIQK